VSFTNAEGRQEILDELAGAAASLATAIACLGVAYERLDDLSAEQLDEQLFGPVQRAYGRAMRTHSEFADRHGLPRTIFPSGAAGAESQSAVALIDRAADAVREADATIAELQDSLLPIEVGDQELRAGLTDARALIDPVPGLAARFIRTVGR
jgi:hypothetical protein